MNPVRFLKIERVTMIKASYALSIGLCNLAVVADSPSPSLRPIIIEHHVHNIQEGASSNVTTTTTTNQVSELSNKIKSISLEKLQMLMHNCYSSIMEHKWTVCGATLLALYFTACYQLVRGNAYFKNRSPWSTWKEEIPLHEFAEIPQSEIARELIISIQRKYLNPKNPSDFFGPLVSFLVDLEAEIRISKRYLKRFDWLEKIYFTYLFPGDTEAFAQAEEKIARLCFIKEIFITWTVEHKLELNTSYYT